MILTCVKDSVDTKWTASAKSNHSTGFLDLPKEVRDVIYQLVCDRLERIGMSWNARVESPDYEWVPRRISHVIETTPSSDATNLLRLCRQVHSEFAVWLYSIPFEFIFTVPVMLIGNLCAGTSTGSGAWCLMSGSLS